MRKQFPQVPELIVGILIYRDDGRILLVKSPKWSNKWICVGGHVEYGEKIIDAINREIKEETNIKVTDIEFLGIQEIIFPKEFHRKTHSVVHLYCARALDAPVQLNDEATEYLWKNPKNVDNLDVFNPTREFINIYLEKHNH